MKHSRIVVTHYGGPDALQVVEEDCPVPRRDQVRVKVLAAGVSLPDIMAREGIHPETPKPPYTPGWDLVGEVESLGAGTTGVSLGQRVASLPIHGAYTQYICLPPNELIPVPSEVDPAEAVCLGLNYMTAYQMMHRSARVKSGQRALIHGASGGVGSALLQLGRLAGLEMYGTCSPHGFEAVRAMGATPIDYKSQDFVAEIKRLTGEGVDVVFDGVGGPHMWRSRGALRRGGRVVVYGLTSSLQGGRLAQGKGGRRNRLHGLGRYLRYVLGGWILPGRRRVVLYSIQWLKRLRPNMFRQDFTTLLTLLAEKKLQPIIAERFPLSAARAAQEKLGQGGVTGKFVLLPHAAPAPAPPANPVLVSAQG